MAHHEAFKLLRVANATPSKVAERAIRGSDETSQQKIDQALHGVNATCESWERIDQKIIG